MEVYILLEYRDDYIPCDSSANLKEIINASW